MRDLDGSEHKDMAEAGVHYKVSDWLRGGVILGSVLLALALLGSVWFEKEWDASGLFLVWLIGGWGIAVIALAFTGQVSGMLDLAAQRVKSLMKRAANGHREPTALSSGKAEDLAEAPIEIMLRRSLTPRLEICSGLDRVCRVAAETIEMAHAARSEDERYITFYGSASLSTTDPSRDRFGRRRGIEQRDEDIQTPEQIYSGALEAAASDQIRIRRYIRLFSEGEFRGRGQAIRREYITWLRMQLYQLKRNPNFRLIDVIRAPEWGSNVARIVTHQRLLEVAGNGEGCLLLVGTNLAEAIRRQSRKAVLGDQDNQNMPVHYGQTRPWRDLPGRWATVEDFENLVVDAAEKAFLELQREGEH